MILRNILKSTIVTAALVLASAGSYAGPVVWIGDAQGYLGTVDTTTGAATVIGNMGAVMTDIAFDSSGHLFGITTTSLYQIDKNTAAATLVGSFGAQAAYSSSSPINSLVFDSAGNLYAAGNALFTVNSVNGQVTFQGYGPSFIGGLHSSGDLAFVGGKLYLSDDYYGYDRLLVVNPNNPSSSSTTYPVNYPNNSYITDGAINYQSVFGLATPDNVHLYGVDGTTILNINVATGAANVLVNYGGQGLGGAYGTAFYTEAGAPAVPVPGAVWLFGSGLLGLAGIRRRACKSA